MLAQSLIAHDLIDEFRLLVYPVVLGSRRRLFADGAAPAAMDLTELHDDEHRRAPSTPTTWAGRPTYGIFELD